MFSLSSDGGAERISEQPICRQAEAEFLGRVRSKQQEKEAKSVRSKVQILLRLRVLAPGAGVNCEPESPTLEGLATTHHSLLSSFSAVSRPRIARNGAFFHIFRDLHDFHTFAPL